LRKLAADLGLSQLAFLGFVHDVENALAHLDIVVHASTVGEPFGQVIIEAMAAAKPVIATNGGGVPEILEHNVTGLLVPMNDPAALAEALRTLLRAPERAHEMGVCGRERVRHFFTIERTAQGVCEAYEGLLNRSIRQPVSASSPRSIPGLRGIIPEEQES
jgi:glycosyltransferase involved in cell wall biosynthesis